MDGFQKELLGRLPLPQATMRVMGYALDRDTLDQVFEAHRGRCYQGILTFGRLVERVLEALTVHEGSGHRAFSAARAQGALPIAEPNVYRKLRHTWKDQYIKAPEKRKPTVASTLPSKVPQSHGGHASTWRILQTDKHSKKGNQR